MTTKTIWKVEFTGVVDSKLHQSEKLFLDMKAARSAADGWYEQGHAEPVVTEVELDVTVLAKPVAAKGPGSVFKVRDKRDAEIISGASPWCRRGDAQRYINKLSRWTKDPGNYEVVEYTLTEVEVI